MSWEDWNPYIPTEDWQMLTPNIGIAHALAAAKGEPLAPELQDTSTINIPKTVL